MQLVLDIGLVGRTSLPSHVPLVLDIGLVESSSLVDIGLVGHTSLVDIGLVGRTSLPSHVLVLVPALVLDIGLVGRTSLVGLPSQVLVLVSNDLFQERQDCPLVRALILDIGLVGRTSLPSHVLVLVLQCATDSVVPGIPRQQPSLSQQRTSAACSRDCPFWQGQLPPSPSF